MATAESLPSAELPPLEEASPSEQAAEEAQPSEEPTFWNEASPSEEATEEAPPSEEPTVWDAVYEQWRNGNQLWLMTYGGGPSGGYIIDYSSERRAMSRWSQSFGEHPPAITPLPGELRLLYTEMHDDVDHVRDFTVEQVRSMIMHELNYSYAADLYEVTWDDIPGESSVDAGITRRWDILNCRH
jgi:hypothetical protein